jgi:hypothetical protein
MAVAVIGGAGFIGSHMVDELMVNGHEVLVVDNLSTGKIENLARWKGNDHLEFVRADADDPFVRGRIADHKNWVFNFAPVHVPELADSCMLYGVKHFMDNTGAAGVGGMWEQEMPSTSFDFEGAYGPRGPSTGSLFVSDIIRANMMAAMNREFVGSFRLSLEGLEEFGWKPLVSQEQGKYISDMYNKVNEGSSLIIASR